MIRLFAGYDAREAVGWSVFVSSVVRHASKPVSITQLFDFEQGDGSNAFTYSRFRVAELCGYDGWALFMDGCDQLMLADVAELWALRDSQYAVQVVKHSYKTRHPMKYRGTSMQCPNIDYPRKNWASAMLINCAAPEWKALGKVHNRKTLQFEGFADERIGGLPAVWNLLVDEGQSAIEPKCLHWTAGIPAFDHYAQAPFAGHWFKAFQLMVAADV